MFFSTMVILLKMKILLILLLGVIAVAALAGYVNKEPTSFVNTSTTEVSLAKNTTQNLTENTTLDKMTVRANNETHINKKSTKSTSNTEIVNETTNNTINSTVSTTTSTEKTEPEPTKTNSIGIDLVLISSGEFEMGAGEYSNSQIMQPTHTVEIKNDFYIGKYEVTQRQWNEIMDENPSTSKGRNQPVDQVSWKEAQEFISKLNKLENTTKYRLPTEAEWEYACKAGTKSSYFFGDDETELGDYAWYIDNSEDETYSVGQKQSNPWGLYDMYGNVFEWVQDDWHQNYKEAPTDGSAWDEPGSNPKVLRGGFWGSSAGNCMSAERTSKYPTEEDTNIGFRIVMET